MGRQVAFLRGMNLGGRRVTNEELIAVLEGLGLEEVGAYQAAGNLIFTGDLDAEALADGLSEALGYEVPVILRSLEQVAAIGQASPFTAEEREASRGKVQVSLLAEAPDEEAAAEVLAMASEEDRLHLDGRELYWLPIAGMSTANLDVQRIEALLGLQTRRTQGTLQRLAKKFG